SIVIINFNTYDLTCQCINSILESNSKIESLQIIIVDNGSSEIQEKPFQQIYKNIEVVSLPENLGFAKANNIGIKFAKGDYLILLNSDVIIDNKDTLFRCIQ